MGAKGCKSQEAARDGHTGAGSTQAPSLPCAAARTAAQRGFVLGAVPWPHVSVGVCCWKSNVQGVLGKSPCHSGCPTNKYRIHPERKGDSPVGPSQGARPCWVLCSASLAALQGTHAAPHPQLQPLSLLLYTIPTSFPDACSLNTPSTGKYFSGLHPSSQTKILNILRTNKWQNTTDTMTSRQLILTFIWCLLGF